MRRESQPVADEIREFQAAGYAIMAHPELDTPGRQAAMLTLLREARLSRAPEFACRAVERSLFESIWGRSGEADYWEAAIEATLAQIDELARIDR